MNLAIAIGATVLLGAFYCWTGRMNAMFFFGRTIAPALRQSDAGQAITRQYLASLAVATCAAVLLSWAASHLGRSMAALGPMAEVVAFSFLFARANGQARRLEGEQLQPIPQSTVVQVSLLEPPSYWIPDLPAIFLPVLLAVASVGATLMFTEHASGLGARWELLNNRLEANGGAMLLGMACGMLTAATGLLLLFRSSARLRTKMAQYTVRASITMEWIAAALLVAVLVCNALAVPLSRNVERGLALVGLAAALGTVVWNQSRSKRFVPPPVELGSDDRWRWGLFYVDRMDPALFVQSRCGAGYSLNYGKALAWPITVALWGYFVGMLFFFPHHR